MAENRGKSQGQDRVRKVFKHLDGQNGQMIKASRVKAILFYAQTRDVIDNTCIRQIKDTPIATSVIKTEAMNMTEIKHFRVKDLISAPFTPLTDEGEVNYSIIQQYADYLVSTKFTGVFINGTLAEGLSLTVDERKKLAESWIQASRGRLEVIVHVGAQCIKDAQEMSKHAEKIGASAIAALSPSYYKPENEDVLVEILSQIADAAPKTPFYYYDINFCTGIYLNARKIMEKGLMKIPTLRGMKFSSMELPNAYDCLLIEDTDLQVLMGTDNQYLTSLALGLSGVVAISVLGNLCFDMKAAFDAGDLASAGKLQATAQKIFRIRNEHGGGIPVAKALGTLLSGIDFGPVRLPLRSLTSERREKLREDISAENLLDIGKMIEQ